MWNIRPPAMFGRGTCFISLPTLHRTTNIAPEEITNCLTQAGFSVKSRKQCSLEDDTGLPYDGAPDWVVLSHGSRAFVLAPDTKLCQLLRHLLVKECKTCSTQVPGRVPIDDADRMLTYASIIYSSGIPGLNTINDASTPTHVFEVIIHNATVFESTQIEKTYGLTRAYKWSCSMTEKWIVGNSYCCQVASGSMSFDGSDKMEWIEAIEEFGRLKIPVTDNHSFAYMLDNTLLLAARFPFKASIFGLAWRSPPIRAFTEKKFLEFIQFQNVELGICLQGCGFVQIIDIPIEFVDCSVVQFLINTLNENVSLYFHESLVLTPSTVMNPDKNP
jgi:hypothetical protein